MNIVLWARVQTEENAGADEQTSDIPNNINFIPLLQKIQLLIAVDKKNRELGRKKKAKRLSLNFYGTTVGGEIATVYFEEQNPRNADWEYEAETYSFKDSKVWFDEIKNLRPLIKRIRRYK